MMSHINNFRPVLRIVQFLMFVTCIRSAVNMIVKYPLFSGPSLYQLGFFTNLGLIYTIFCIFCGILSRYFSSLKSIHNFSLGTSVVLSTMVTLNFWGLYLIDPKLVKKEVDEISIRVIYSEFFVHLFPMIVLFLEILHNPVQKSQSHRVFLVLFGIFYTSLLEILNYVHKSFVYAFLDQMNFVQRFGFLILFIMIELCLYEVIIREPRKDCMKNVVEKFKHEKMA